LVSCYDVVCNPSCPRVYHPHLLSFKFICTIGCGLMVSAFKPEHRTRCNAVGNASGASLIIFSFVFSSSEGDPIWDRSRSFYLVVGLPCVLGIISAAAISSLPCFGLSGPEKSSVCIECCYQNVALAQAVAINMYEGKEAGIAVGVPVFYGLVEIVTIGIFCLTSWKAGVTYAPANDPLWKVVTHSYQVTSTVVPLVPIMQLKLTALPPYTL